MRKIVIKIGSSSLIDENLKLNEKIIDQLMEQIAFFKTQKIISLIVTSGAIAVGANKLGIKPKLMGEKQACAAVGQASLMHAYDFAANKYNLKTAQILLNHDDFENRKRMLNLEATISSLIDQGVVPIINENDALAVEEIKVGDNDTLSALISSMAKADYLVIISDIDGLYDKNPKIAKDANLIKIVTKITPDIEKMASGSNSSVGTGGMITKIKAAKIATASGVNMLIINNKITNLAKMFDPDYEGTLFLANTDKLSAKAHWVMYKVRPKGSIIIDEGAKKAILSHRSLLPIGIIGVEKTFAAGNILEIKCNKEIIAKGISNYSSEDILKIKGLDSDKLENILGYKGKNVVIHANDIVLGGE